MRRSLISLSKLVGSLPEKAKVFLFFLLHGFNCKSSKSGETEMPFFVPRSTMTALTAKALRSSYLLIVTTLWINLAHAVEREPLAFLCAKNYAPMTYQENGQPKGVIVDVLKALSQRIGRRIDIQFTDLKEAQQLVTQGKADGLCQMSITESKKSPFEFSDSIMTLRFSIFSRNDKGYISDLSDLRGMKVGATAGGMPWMMLEKDPLIQIVSINDYKEGFQMLKDGKLDAVFGDNWVGGFVLAEEGIVEVRANDDSIARIQSAIAFKKGNRVLRDEINEGLRSLKKDGTLGRIYDEWRPKELIYETREQAQKKLYSVAGGVFGLLLLITSVWVLSLRREVAIRKRSEMLAERERLRLSTILRTASDGIHILDRNGLLVEANEAFLNMLGYDNSAIGKLYVSDWLTLDNLKADRELINVLLKQHTRIVFETRHRRSDGAILDVEISASGIEIEGESFIYAALRDITKRKLAEQQSLIAATAFESQEGMFITDAQQVILRINHAFTEITGFTEKDAIGQKPSLLNSGRHTADFYSEMTKMISQNGAWKGEIFNSRKNGEVFPGWLTITAVKTAEGKVTNYVAMLTDITERKIAENEINNLAFFDPLTNLPNRRLLYDRLKQVQIASTRDEKYGALLMIDLDKFKALNDTHGHDYGDMLLQQISKNLCSCVRKGDTVARLGGDEFVIVLKNLNTNQQESIRLAEAIAKKVLATLNLTYQLGKIEHPSSGSIGATIFIGTQTSMDDILKQADLAMYKSKQQGRNTVNFFDPSMAKDQKHGASETTSRDEPSTNTPNYEDINFNF